MPRRAVLILLAPARLKNHPRRWQRLSRFGQTTIPQPFFQHLLTATISAPHERIRLTGFRFEWYSGPTFAEKATIFERDFAAQGAVNIKYQTRRTPNSATTCAR